MSNDVLQLAMVFSFEKSYNSYLKNIFEKTKLLIGYMTHFQKHIFKGDNFSIKLKTNFHAYGRLDLKVGKRL